MDDSNLDPGATLSDAMSSVYLDNAASTRPLDQVVRLMAEVATDQFANPSSAHAAGAAAARLLEAAREELAGTLGAAPAEVVFTSGGTEANGLAVHGATSRARGRHLVVSAIEHPAVLRNAERLAAERGFAITWVPPTPSGVIEPAQVAAALRPDTALVAVMLVNNELGTVQPVTEIARALATHAAENGQRRPHFHVDAVQGFGLLAVRPALLGADSLALSAHKVHGPKGVGALWLRAGARLAPFWEGGGQERGTRSGTENLPGIVGFARAATRAAQANTTGAAARIAALRDDLETRIRQYVPAAHPTVPIDTTLLAPGTLAAAGGGSVLAVRAPHISSLCFPGWPAEPLLHALAARGVTASAGSACASKLRGPSHVLKALGVIDDDTAVLRFSLSRFTTAEEIGVAAQAVAAAVAELAPASRRASRWP